MKHICQGSVLKYSFIVLTIVFGLFASASLQAKNFQKVVKEVEVGMDSAMVVKVAGVPTKSVQVTRLFYETDEVVLSHDEVIDIRLADKSHKVQIKRLAKGKEKHTLHKVSLLRIGMAQSEVISIAGAPSTSMNGYDLYYSDRHRVELSNGKVSRVDIHLKKGLDILDWIRLNFSSGGLLFMNITLAFIMFGVALGIKVEHFKQIINNPKSAIVGVVSQFIALPALTFILILIIQPSPSVALGMILVAACPGGNISNFISSLAKGNVALSVSLTAFATLAAIILTPLNFALWGKLYSGTANLVVPIEIDPWEMMKTVFILLGVPIVLGIWFSNKFPKTTLKIKRPISIFSVIAFLGFIAAAFASNFKFFLEYIHLVFLIVLIHNIVALLTGFSLASIFRLPRPDRRTLSIETGIQNSGLGLVLIFNPNLFDGLGGMAFIAAWWGIWHIIAGLTIATIWSRKPLS
ncbi:MAG TPA: bile acid:sodium symporter family protein [Tenuifilaceae bacterium]|nr:bile acid:sodium symporter family protein [Tenuifilaceae bacterium]HPE17743.1 bile acid:sodium symporter family protein [Tenuifilaceae bacterium]